MSDEVLNFKSKMLNEKKQSADESRQKYASVVHDMCKIISADKKTAFIDQAIENLNKLKAALNISNKENE